MVMIQSFDCGFSPFHLQREHSFRQQTLPQSPDKFTSHRNLDTLFVCELKWQKEFLFHFNSKGFVKYFDILAVILK